MSGYRSRGGHAPPQPSHRPSSNLQYDDYASGPRSPAREYRSPREGRSSPHDIPDGPAADVRYHRANEDRGVDRRSQNYDSREYRHERPSPSPPRGRNTYRDRDRERYCSPSHDSRNSSRSHGSHDDGRRAPSRGRPRKEVMLEGLASHLTEDDILAELQQHYHVEGLEDVRVIRDRQTKISRQFGFLRFQTLELAENFMDQNHPFVYLYGKMDATGGDSNSAKVRIEYTRERKEGNRDKDEADWICRICNINNFSTRVRCFRCQTPKTDAAVMAPVKTANTGDNDASPDNTPSQFLLLRGLEPSVSEELFAKGVGKLFKPSGPSSQPNQPAAKKGGRVASTTGDGNLGAREGTLRRILLVRDRRSNESWRYGFAEYATIEDSQAALTRYNSFDRFTIASKQVLVSYVHAGVFVPVLNPTASTERFTFSPLGNPSVKLAYWDEDAYVAELVVAKAEPSLSESKKSGSRVVPTTDVEVLKPVKETDKTKKRKGEPTTVNATKKAAPSHLQFWSNRHAELHGIDQKGGEASGSEKSAEIPQDTAPPSRSYADSTRNCCYLCSRQFNSAAEVNKHERMSDLHRQNLKDAEKVKKAEAKLEKHGIDPSNTSNEYRDRAKERRKVYGVVNKKGEQVGSGPKLRAISDDDEEKAVVQSKGASLLSKMGYTAGKGLGVSGEGITTAISQDVYAAGVGLGAQGGKLGEAVAEAARNTKDDYSAFAAKTREGARERYSRM